MEKHFNLGKIDYNESGRRNCMVDVRIELIYKDGKPCFRASGNVWNPRNTDIYQGGQCLDELDKYKSIHNNGIFKDVYYLWKKHHLNDLHAGTARQEEIVDKWLARGHRYDYGEICRVLSLCGLYEDNGYKYGHGWIYKDIPENDIELINKLMKMEG